MLQIDPVTAAKSRRQAPAWFLWCGGVANTDHVFIKAASISGGD